ncbi:hypothetical protein [Streptomyces sp. NBC_01465]|uniref:hypothetical protein n=1 Tax=Streptomyces sp. NBC_01465 TaxID=2903878 RepID=UPI002E3418BA|nr:hypothetical protein [Streptomyces sp. NBC_01465]
MKRRFTAILASAATAALALLGPNSAPAQAADDPGLALNNFVLRPIHNEASLVKLNNDLKADLPTVGVNQILQDADSNQGTWSTGVCNKAATPSGDPEGFSSSFCFDDDDAGEVGTSEWRPQGVTSVADADEDQIWGDPAGGWNPADHKPMIVTWYHLDDEGASTPDNDGKDTSVKGARISIIDRNTGKYAHVLLVYPYDNVNDNASYMSLRTSQHYGKGSLHAGGIVWYGYKLYVPDTARGFRVFDLRDIMDLKAAGDKADLSKKLMVGRQDNVYYSHGYRYVLPESSGWTNTTCDDLDYPNGLPVCDMQDEQVKCTENDITPRTSYASLDRSEATRHIVSGEWCEQGNAVNAKTTGRVIRWPMQTSGGIPQTDASGNWRADAAYRIPYEAGWAQNGTVQGAAVINKTWYLSQSYGSGTTGHLIVANQPGSSTGNLTAAGQPRRAAIGVEDLSVWPQSGTDIIWTVTEFPKKRMLYSVTE